jgi:phosphoglycolate phosphatase-like HAD superfamily hydrolase
MRAMRSAGRRLFGDRIEWKGIEAAGSLDPLIFAEAAQRSGISGADRHHESFRAQYLLDLRQELARHPDRVQTMPGVPELLASLRERVATRGDLVMGMLTGNYGPAVSLKLAAVDVDLDQFAVTAFGDEAPNRAELVALAMQRYEKVTGQAADPRRVVVIGDTPRDVACARANGCVSFAVATGEHSESDLRAAGASVAVEDLSDPEPLLELLG